MKISIITPTFNSAKTVRDTLGSLVAQNYADLECLIIDGDSSDETLSIIKEYQAQLKIKLVSEKDNGLYDAMNKGISLATGEIIGILNSDDFYLDNTLLNRVSQAFSDNPEAGIVYSDLRFVNAIDTAKTVRIWHAGKYKESKLNNGWIIPHPTCFVRKEIYDKYGLFNSKMRLAADYEFLLRALKVNKVEPYYLPGFFVAMRTGGLSANSLKQRKTGWRELKQAWTINGLRVPRFFILRRVLFKLRQYLV